MNIVMHAGALGASPYDTALDTFMRALAEKYADPNEWSGKYGTNVDNEDFMMHPFCWCEKEDCLWCAGCKCGSDSIVLHYWDDQLVSSDEQWEHSKQLLGKLPHELYEHGTKEYEAYAKEWDKRVKERNRRSRTVYPAVTHTCEPLGLMENQLESDKASECGYRAPNLWLKSTGLKVWWYKYIGRDTSTNRDVTADDLALITSLIEKPQ